MKGAAEKQRIIIPPSFRSNKSSASMKGAAEKQRIQFQREFNKALETPQ